MAWGDKKDGKAAGAEEQTAVTATTAPAEAAETARRTMVTVSTDLLDEAEQEINRFMRRLKILRERFPGDTAEMRVKASSPALVALRRASQDVSLAMRQIRQTTTGKDGND